MSGDEIRSESSGAERPGADGGNIPTPDERIVRPASASVDAEVEWEMRRRSRRAFLVGGLAAIAGYGGWRFLRDAPIEDGVPAPFRSVLRGNERLWRGFFGNGQLAPTFPVRAASMPKVNGDIGLDPRWDAANWRLRIHGLGEESVRMTPDGRLEQVPLLVTMEEILALPRVEMVTEFKCIEGWSTVTHWTGARLSDLVMRYGGGGRAGSLDRIAGRLPEYVSLETPDRGYYVGLDLASALHPQTLLCYAMGGRMLTPLHGAPLRLVVPVKYGIKNIKRIGAIRFTAQRPADYWAERGYDWYAGL